MDFELNDDQRAILEAVGQLLERHAGPERAIELQASGEYDVELEAALTEAGFYEGLRESAMGPLEAALITEAVAGAAGGVAFAAGALVAPAICDEPFAGPIAVCERGHAGPIRFAAQARTLLIYAGDEVLVVGLESGDAKSVASNFGYPMGAVPSGIAQRGRSLGPGSGEALERWWRLGLAIEAVGTMGAALAQTVAYLKERKQFGRRIASFQAVQHRLAECAISHQGSRWLCLEAAHRGAPAEATATAAAYAMQAASQIFSETHQLSGAIGYTREHDLHVFSMRLQALRLEFGGVAAHRRAIVTHRWGSA
jgi:alkylation response protein AidB-like acyl-CoA dehydrogenase